MSKNKKSALITGVTGFIGSHLANFLKDRWELRGLARGVIKPVIPSIPFIKADITKIEDLKNIRRNFNPETVFHLAALTKRRYLNTPRKEYMKVNVAGTENVFKAFPASKVIYTSTCGVRYSSRHPYFETKSLAGKICLDYSNGMIARLTNVYGEGKTGGVLSVFIDCALRNEDLPLHNGQIRDFISVMDVSRALELLAEKGECRKIYEVCFGEGTAISWLAEKVIEFTSSKSSIQLTTKPKRDVVGDIKPLKELGFTPKYSFEDFIKKVCEDTMKKKAAEKS